MVTISESTRRTTYQPTTPTTVFPVGYPIFDNDDLRVTLDGEPFLSFTVSGTYINGIATDAAINVTGPGIIGDVVIDGYRLPRRTDQYKNGAPLKIEDHNYSLNRVEITLQELRRDTDDNTSRIDGMIGDVAELAERAETAASNAEAANTSAQQASDESEQARDEAVAAAAGVNLPSVSIGNAGQTLVVKPDGSGYDLRTTTISVPTRTVLKALPIVFKSAYLAEANREGQFILKAGSPPVADVREGIYVVSNVSGYYWQRVFKDGANVLWFGAAGDNATNDAPIVNDALTVWRDVYLPARLPNGQLATYRFSTSITLNAGNCIHGDPSRSKITLSPAMSVDVFNVVGTQVTAKDLLIYGDRTQTNRLFRFRTDLGNVAVVKINNVWSDGCAGIYHDANSTGVLTNLFISDCTNTGVTGRSVYFQDGLAFIFLQRVTFDYVGVTESSSNVAAIVIANNEGAILEDVDVLGGTKVGFANRDGIRIENSRAVWLKRCMADHMGGWGFYVSDCDYVYFETCTSSLCNKDQFYINTNSRWVTATNCYAGGSNGETGAIAGVHGWLIENSLQVTVTGGTISNCTGKAIVTSGATTRFVGTGIMMMDNVGGNYTLGSTMSHLVGCTKADGTLTAYPTTNVSG